MDKKAKLLDRLQNLAIAVLSLSFLFLLVQTPLFGDTGDTTIASTVRGWFTDRQTSAAEEPDSLAALAVPVRIVQSNDFIRSGLDALTTADDAFETVGSFLGEAIGSARGISSVSENTFLSALDGSGLYFAFACDLPLEVLSARLGVQSPTARQLDVRRCLLGLDGEDTATLYLQDTKQGVYRFSTAVSAASVRDYLESQDGGNADFARSLGEGYTSLSPYTLVFDSVSARRELSAANALSDYPSEELLRRAEFNPHTKDRYVESSGTEVVIEGQRKLYLHTDGMLSYSGGAAEDGSLFAVAAADAAHISRAELCAAARGLVGALTQAASAMPRFSSAASSPMTTARPFSSTIWPAARPSALPTAPTLPRFASRGRASPLSPCACGATRSPSAIPCCCRSRSRAPSRSATPAAS